MAGDKLDQLGKQLKKKLDKLMEEIKKLRGGGKRKKKRKSR
jgi:hypothetical protein